MSQAKFFLEISIISIISYLSYKTLLIADYSNQRHPKIVDSLMSLCGFDIQHFHLYLNLCHKDPLS